MDNSTLAGIVTLEGLQPPSDFLLRPEEVKPTIPIQKRTDKVAIVGFAPSSMKLAPFADESWEIWTLNNIYASTEITRYDRWFELHQNFRQYAAFHDNRMDAGAIVRGDSRVATGVKIEHIDWLKDRTPDKPIYFLNDEPDIPAAVKYPKDEVLEWAKKEKLRGWRYFTNSISWMIALALMDGYKTIGVWGVDMAAGGEYELEKPSVEYWLGIVEKYGELVLPEQSELLNSPLYGYEVDASHVVKWKTRQQEMAANRNQAEGQAQQATFASHYFRGAEDNMGWVIRNQGHTK